MANNELQNWTAEQRAICDAATKGPWISDIRNGCMAIYPGKEKINCLAGASETALHYKQGHRDDENQWRVDPEDEANNDFIANARTAHPRALDIIERLAGLIHHDFGCASEHMVDDVPYLCDCTRDERITTTLR